MQPQSNRSSGSLTTPLSRYAGSWWGSLLICLGFALALVRNCIFPLGGIWVVDGKILNDPPHFIWSLWHLTEAITSGHSPYRANDIYYPVGAHLIHSSVAEGFFPITWVVKILSGNSPMYPFYAYHIIILICFVLLLYFSYWFLRELSFHPLVAMTVGVMFAFSRFFVDHGWHITALAGFFIPLTAWLLVRLYRHPSMGRLFAVAASCGGAFYFTEFSVYLSFGALSVLIALVVFQKERLALWSRLKVLGGRGVFAGIALFILIVTPFAVNHLSAGVINPSMAETAGFSANLASLVVPNAQRTPLYDGLFASIDSRVTVGMRGYEIFVGFPLLLFALAGVVFAGERLIRVMGALALIFFFLSLGPTLKVLSTDTGVPMPYALLMKIPPFDLSRTPGRFMVLGTFFLMPAAASGVVWLQNLIAKRFGTTLGLIGLIFVLGWTVAEAYAPLPHLPVFAPPAELSPVTPGPVLNLPVSIFDGYAGLLQVFHHQPIATGFISRNSEAQVAYVDQLKKDTEEGDQGLCDDARRRGFRTIILSPVSSTEAPFDLSGCTGLTVVDLRKPDGRFPEYLPGTRIDLSQAEAEKYLPYGWSPRETVSRWTDGRRAIVAFSANQTDLKVMRIKLAAFVVAGRLDAQRVEIKLNGKPAGELVVSKPVAEQFTISLPPGVVGQQNVLSIDLPNAESPRAIGISSDGRLLGINVQWIEFDSQ